MTAVRPTMRTPPPSLAEAWWPLEDVAPTDSRWFADHLEAGWWDPGDLDRARLRLAGRLVDELLAALPAAAIAPGATVLELGCGPGHGMQELAVRWPGSVHAWDPSPDARTAAHDLALADAVVHDAPAPPLALADGTVDVVWAPRAFARGDADWAGLLAEAHRVLRPDGLLVAVVAGPGAWAWEEGPDPWDEPLTGLLALGLDRPDARGGPVVFSSAWWREEHWGRGFERVASRPAGVAMTHPDQGFGLEVRRRRPGPALPAARLAAARPGDVREGRAQHRQLALAHAEARRCAERTARGLAAMEGRLAALRDPGAVERHPQVRDAEAAVAALERDVEGRRARPLVRAASALRGGRGPRPDPRSTPR